MIVVPVTHDLIHSPTVDTARLPLSLPDEVTEERGAWRKCHMVDVAVQRLVHSEHELSQTTSFHYAAHLRRSDCVNATGCKLGRLILSRNWFWSAHERPTVGAARSI